MRAIHLLLESSNAQNHLHFIKLKYKRTLVFISVGISIAVYLYTRYLCNIVVGSMLYSRTLLPDISCMRQGRIPAISVQVVLHKYGHVKIKMKTLSISWYTMPFEKGHWVRGQSRAVQNVNLLSVAVCFERYSIWNGNSLLKYFIPVPRGNLVLRFKNSPAGY